MIKAKNSLLEMSADDENLQDDLLTMAPEDQILPDPKKPRGPGRPPAMCMMGVRMTKNQRYEYKKLAAQLRMSVQDMVQLSLDEFKARRGLR